MGYTDFELNRKKLKKHNLHLSVVVEEFIAGHDVQLIESGQRANNNNNNSIVNRGKGLFGGLGNFGRGH